MKQARTTVLMLGAVAAVGVLVGLSVMTTVEAHRARRMAAAELAEKSDEADRFQRAATRQIAALERAVVESHDLIRALTVQIEDLGAVPVTTPLPPTTPTTRPPPRDTSRAPASTPATTAPVTAAPPPPATTTTTTCDHPQGKCKDKEK